MGENPQASSASFTLHGAGVSGGIAIGHAHLVSTARLEVAHYEIAPQGIEAEIARFDKAITQVRGELAALQASVSAGAPAEMKAILSLHAMLLNDSNLSAVPRELIGNRRCNAEWALVLQMDYLVSQFDEMDDPYLRERKQDIVQVVERVLKAMLGTGHAPAEPSSEKELIVVAHDLSPADMILFKQHQYAGFVTDLGGVTSHTAIVARGLNIPAIVGLHHARSMIWEGELVIVDGREGVLIVNPGARVLEEYRRLRSEIEAERQKLKRLRTARSATMDGVVVDLQANIELPQDVKEANEAGAAGVGLFRSEFLFLNRTGLPSEDEQFEAYRRVAAGMDGKPVTIRTFDLGADKHKEGLEGLSRVAPNPALGLRAVRFCLAEPRLFVTQLRAILRASHFGNVKILIPMLSSASEIDQTLVLLAQAKESLREQNVPFDPDIEVGGMLEIPAAVLAISTFTRRLDFLSIGTNDLTQYTLAVDRADDTVSHLYDPLHPAVLKLVALAITAANRAKVPVAVCGEMAGEARLTRLLLGMGLRNFSMHPAHVPSVKQKVLTTDIARIRPQIQRICRCDNPEK